MIPWLVQRLAQRHCRAAARNALARFGDEVVPRLVEAWLETDTAAQIRNHLPRVLAEIPTPRSVDALTALLPRARSRERLLLLKALNRLRASHPELPFARERLLPVLHAETERHAHLQSLQRARGSPIPTPQGRLLWRALEEQVTASVARTFRILGLLGAPKDVYDAYVAVAGGDRASRAFAIELLDNVLDAEVVGRVVDMLDPDPAAPSVRSCTVETWLARVIRETEGWLRACAVFAAIDQRSPEVLMEVRAAARDDDPAVREAATAILSR
jgi:hypothetical protein